MPPPLPPLPAAAAVAALFGPWIAPVPPPAGAPPDLDHILERARAAQQQDMDAWRLYRFRRTVVREKLDKDGEPRAAETLDFTITPAEGGFDELVLRIDGRPPTIHEIREHRRKARFTKHYETARTGEPEDDDSAGFSLGLLLHLSSHTYAGREVIDGVACHRLDFRPSEGEQEKGTAARVAAAMQGSLWITEEGYHLFRGEAVSIRPVRFYLGLAALRSLEVSMTSGPVEGGAWLPREIRVRTEAHALGVPIRKRNTYRYFDYERALTVTAPAP